MSILFAQLKDAEDELRSIGMQSLADAVNEANARLHPSEHRECRELIPDVPSGVHLAGFAPPEVAYGTP